MGAYFEIARYIGAIHLQKLPTYSLAGVRTSRRQLPPPTGAKADQYFPPGVLGSDDCEDGFLTEWYSMHLKALREPSLWTVAARNSKARAFRFLWLRTFHHPLSVRVEINSDGTGLVISKVAGGKGGYEPGVLIHDTTKTIGPYGTNLVIGQMLGMNFWGLPTRGTPGGTDGAQWILEAVLDGRYDVVDRWSPDQSDPVYKLGMMFVDLAGLPIEPRDLY